MNVSIHQIYLLLVFFLPGVSAYAQLDSYVSLKQHTEVLENKKKMTNEVDIYFDNNKKIITKYYHAFNEFVMVTNSLGEIKTYYPATNEVAYRQITELASKRSLIYYFANNLTDHLGLADEGFNLSSTAWENQFYVTIWKAPSVLKGIETVRMVFENGLPVYSEYQANREKVIKKIYYTNYKDFTRFRLPLKIIEVSYLPSGDSIINRTLFTNVKVSSTPDHAYFNFKIPDDAKPLSVAKGQ